MIYEELSRIQKELKAPKGQFNKFGNYKYRSCEDILEAAKPLLNKCCLTITDDIILVGERFYVKATARLSLTNDDFIEVSAFARESDGEKGMQSAQLTGSTSSYARKYALDGLFAIDDTKEIDSGKKEGLSENIINSIREVKTLKELSDFYNANKNSIPKELKSEFNSIVTTRKEELSK